jgi:hypothetical protein
MGFVWASRSPRDFWTHLSHACRERHPETSDLAGAVLRLRGSSCLAPRATTCVILAGGTCWNFLWGELTSVFPRLLALHRPIATLLEITREGMTWHCDPALIFLWVGFSPLPQSWESPYPVLDNFWNGDNKHRCLANECRVEFLRAMALD